ncbi:DNA topoisomeras-like protein III [Calycina marina]|uniref:DNA topoisomerase n=1 Tax=Calycina marina TaxID=1763456 RepID=A0A9P7Z9R7_9HELO|nr:DNA topoisomeras-like protein III [Calycina marina]
MLGKILCVAEKPSIAKAVAGHLSGGSYQTANTGHTYTKNYTFDFDFGGQWGRCNVVMTCVSGHLTGVDFGPQYKSWDYPPPEALFDAEVMTLVDQDKTAIAKNIETQARGAMALFIWTDCDREGEHIGGEVRTEALKGNARIEVRRARFSNIEKVHVMHAAKNPIDLDQRQIDAVSARIELDLRIGYAFTRFQTKLIQALGGVLADTMISYGSCQFPTLGFVVDRYLRVKNFVPEKFWSIKIMHCREDIDVVFNWRRNHLFDRAVVVILFERCIAAKIAKVTKVLEKPTRKFKPYPLTTVEFQKAATSWLRMNGQTAMTIAENLYNKGFISYPRTETDRFDKGIDLKALVAKQIPDNRWGLYAQDLANGAFKQPREGRHDDKAHPPIHPIAHCEPAALNADEGKVYEFITRRFLACCSDDAKGQQTDVEIEYGDENFHTHGVIVLERNYLDVYPYHSWNNTVMLPNFTLGERFEPTEAMITDGQTSAPSYLTEADLISLMDANGIGTDATMAEHIAKIKEREYVFTRARGGGGGSNVDYAAARGRRGDRGGGRGPRGGGSARGAGNGGGGLEEFIPSKLGMALVDGYDRMELDISFSKPFLRKELELRMKAICEGTTTKQVVMCDSIRQYRRVFNDSKQRQSVLRSSCRRFVLEGAVQ